MQAVKRAVIAAASVGALLTALGAGPAAATPVSHFTWTPSASLDYAPAEAIVNANNISPLNDFAAIQVHRAATSTRVAR